MDMMRAGRDYLVKGGSAKDGKRRVPREKPTRAKANGKKPAGRK